MVEAARAQGINGVPFVIIDGKWAVNGLQPKECFIQACFSIALCFDSERSLMNFLSQIFRKLAQLPAPSAVPGKPKTKHEL